HAYACKVCLMQATAPTGLYPLSLHDALPISTDLAARPEHERCSIRRPIHGRICAEDGPDLLLIVIQSIPQRARCAALYVVQIQRSEEHTSELQSRENLVCSLLLEKKTPQQGR